MKRITPRILMLLAPLLLFLTSPGQSADLDIVLQDISGGQGVGKADISGQRFEMRVAKLAPTTEFTVAIQGSFTQEPMILGRFLTSAKGSARFRIDVTDIDLSLVQEVELRLSDADGGAVVMRGLVR